MKKRELAKKGLALVLTAAMCAQPLMVSAEEFSFQSEMDGAAVMEAEPEAGEAEAEAADNEGFEDFQSGDALEDAEGMTGEASAEEVGETDDFVDGFTDSAADLGIDESAATVLTGVVRYWDDNAYQILNGITWRLDANGVLYLEGKGELPENNIYCYSEDESVDLNDYSATSLVVGSEIGGWLTARVVYSFKDNLQNLVINDRAAGVDLKIGAEGFRRVASLKNVILGDGVSYIGYAAFEDCTELQEVIIPDSVIEYGENSSGYGGTFYDCTSLKKVVLSKNAKKIPRGMFYGCSNLADITIPEGVTTIGGAFYGISADAEIFIPDSVTSIESWPNCKITMPCRFAFENNGNNYRNEGYYFYHMNGKDDHDEDNCTVCHRTGSVGSDATYDMTLSGKTTISGSGSVSCYDWRITDDITSLIIKDGIYYVDGFSNSKKLESIVLSDSVKKIGNFSGCKNLKSIVIGKGLENDFYFDNCPQLESVTISSENPNYTSINGVIYNKAGTKLVYYPANLAGEEYVIPEGVENISRDAFCYNQNLKKLTVPASVQTLEAYANMPWFRNCKSLETVILNNTMISVPRSFFSNSEALKEIVVPEGTEYIEPAAFYLCKNLKTITLPASIIEINEVAFDGCSSLSTVHYLGTEAQWQEIKIGQKNEYLTDANIHYCTLVEDNTTGCENAGNRVYSCATCGTTFTVNVPKTEHAYSDWVVTREATCALEGELTSTCKKCGDAKHKSIQKKNHVYSDWTVTKAATCTEEGERTSVCKNCGDTRHETIRKKDHDFEWMGGVDATCEGTGLTDAKKCVICGYVAVPSEVISAKGHDFEWMGGVDATCEGTGLTDAKKCVVCGYVAVPSEVIPAKGHDYYIKSKTWTSCTEKGVEVDACHNCSKEVTKELPVRGHIWSSTSSYAPTVLEPGKTVSHCGQCGYDQVVETEPKIPSFASLNTTSITLQVKQSTTKVKLLDLLPGDSVKSWKSSNTKIVKVTQSGKIIAQNKTGKAKVTVTLLGGATATVNVKVQKGVVKTTKVYVVSKATIKPKKKLYLDPIIYPLTTGQKVTYTSSNKKVATVSAKGVVTAKKKGTAVITVKSGSKKATVKITVK